MSAFADAFRFEMETAEHDWQTRGKAEFNRQLYSTGGTMTYDIVVQPAEDRDKGAYAYTVAYDDHVQREPKVVAFGHAATPQFAFEQAMEAAQQRAAPLTGPYLGRHQIEVPVDPA